jgi:large subunit ribosomal protein L17
LKRSIVNSLFASYGERGYIITTREKAKFCRPFAERLITIAKEDTVHRRRLAFARLRNKEAVAALFNDIAPVFKDRPGGYTRILKLPKKRLGDKATQALFGFVQQEAETEAKPKAKKEA